MAKKPSTKKNRLIARAARRRQSLKIDAPVKGRVETLQEKNRSVIAAIEEKMNS